MALFRDNLFVNEVDYGSGESSLDEEYEAAKEVDQGDDDEERAFEEEVDLILAQNATSVDNFEKEGTMVVSNPTKEGGKNVSKRSSEKRKGRGPNKNLKVTEPMYLEYNDLGQPCGRWRKKYGHIGLCVRKLSILQSWNEVPEGLKTTLWQDTMVSQLKSK